MITYYSSSQIQEWLTFDLLIPALKKGFTEEYVVPERMHLNFQNPSLEKNTLLLMPAISLGNAVGVKVVTVNPGNSEKGLPGVQGIYYLCDAATGMPRALFDAKAITNWRTAATSVLAASFLAVPDAKKLLVIGTGALASYLIDAYATIGSIDELYVWGRNPEKAKELIQQKKNLFRKSTLASNLEDAIKEADIISSATFSQEPLIKGKWLRAGQHIDLVGSFRPDMRETDDQVMQRSNIYVDSISTAPKESGDLTIPIANKVISVQEINGDLFQLCKSEINGRQSKEEITVFKSVGHALEDLVAAQLIVQQNNK
ncbi:bifunctional Delta(1)-pyrroline-2-carboxylate/Delta(1)-piperideine-2-carboxylate reductase [Ekhidna sp.]